MIGWGIITIVVKLDNCAFYVKIQIWLFFFARIVSFPLSSRWFILESPTGLMDNSLAYCWSLLMRTLWSHGHTTHTQRHQFLKKPSKSSLIRVWHKDNLYLGTSTIGNGDPHPTNIDSRTRSIRMTPWRQLFFDKSFSVV
jgi:hypothetical protein